MIQAATKIRFGYLDGYGRMTTASYALSMRFPQAAFDPLAGFYSKNGNLICTRDRLLSQVSYPLGSAQLILPCKPDGRAGPLAKGDLQSLRNFSNHLVVNQSKMKNLSIGEFFQEMERCISEDVTLENSFKWDYTEELDSFTEAKDIIDVILREELRIKEEAASSPAEQPVPKHKKSNTPTQPVKVGQVNFVVHTHEIRRRIYQMFYTYSQLSPDMKILFTNLLSYYADSSADDEKAQKGKARRKSRSKIGISNHLKATEKVLVGMIDLNRVHLGDRLLSRLNTMYQCFKEKKRQRKVAIVLVHGATLFKRWLSRLCGV